MERLSKIDMGDDLFAVIVPRVNALVDAVNAIGEIHGDGVNITVNEALGFCIELVAPPPTPAAAPGEEAVGYSGFFACSDASTTEGETKTLKVSVSAGYAIFNGTVFSVAADEITVTASGFLFLKSTMGVDDPPLPLTPEFEYLATYPTVEDGVGRRLIATVSVDGNSMTITQQNHGEVQAFIWGECEDE